MQPLADRLRPRTLDEVAGQQHLIGASGVLRKIVESGVIPNMVFYGPPGIGKTTVANIISQVTSRRLYRLNGTTASIGDVKAIVDELDTFLTPDGALLYLDEIQYFNKKQQQTLLSHMENGKLTLIASTTENPYFYIYPAVLSRLTVFEFKPLKKEDVESVVLRAFDTLRGESGESFVLEQGVAGYLAAACAGDVRKAVGAAELAWLTCPPEDGQRRITLAACEAVAQRSSMRYDRDGDSHFDLLSALHKSIRGSDPDAAVHYLARLLLADDLPSVCRRLLAIASEDVGLAWPQAVSIVKSCVDSALQLGMPEARLPLTEAALLLATAPKSNSALMAIERAIADIQAGRIGDVPDHLKDGHYAGAEKLGHAVGYRYPHDFEHHYTPQQYLPDELKGAHYYDYGPNKFEQANKNYWDEIKKKHR
ncbi:replication-associated recombination protein A [Feifania hominis]|uniref:Replication-associated recombination protein A n=1 Tax=Feifania hominis TaxID=2763660 RepID=A0A926HUV5_9FIRM|nr:replication-associated recombination protein A [Feifania hominis]MBC8536330.1 replication-associated recombination protein A [Feifania hominis]